MTEPADAIAYFLSPEAVRDRCLFLYQLAQEDQLQHFKLHEDRLEIAVEKVLAITRHNYPDLNVPLHARWRHFEVGGMNRIAQLQAQLNGLAPQDQAKAHIDLVLVSVLLDAGAGAQWQYGDAATGEWFGRSEGLAIASYDLFCSGLFSSNPQNPYQVDAQGLLRLTVESLAAGMQVHAGNPMVGLEGRVQLLRQLGQVISTWVQGLAQPARPGDLFDFLQLQSHRGELQARQLLITILRKLGQIWPGRSQILQQNLGDTWPHSALTALDPTYPYVPFHKLSQWLSYSLVEPLALAGLKVVNLDQLTGLAEYRNGGLFIDTGVLELRDPMELEKTHAPSSELIVEWRSLTVILLDRLAQQLRQKLQKTSATLTLGSILQGGTWSAGRALAQHRPGSIPPLSLASDGTVF